MAKIVLVPIPEFGHLNPTFKLARSLTQRGHSVYYLSIPDLEEYVCYQGFEFIPIFNRTFPKGSLHNNAPQEFNNLDRVLLQLGNAHTREAAVTQIEEAFKKSGADLLLMDNLLRDLGMIGRRLGILCVLYSATLWEGSMKLIQTAYNPAADFPVLILCPRELDIPSPNSQRGPYYIEAGIDLERRDLHSFPWDKVDNARRLIYCSLGSQSHQYKQSYSFFRAVLGAMDGNPESQLILTIGPRLNVNDFQPIPKNVVVVNWAPQLDILKKASLMMHNAALGSIKDCIFFSVPMIVFPVMWEQPDNAARVVYHGLGVRGNIDTVSAQQIHNLIGSLDDPVFRTRIDAMSGIFRRIESSGVGVKVIEGILNGALPT